MSIPTAARVLPLAQKRKLVAELAQALAHAKDRQDLTLVRLLEKAVVLAHQLEQSVRQTQVPAPPAESSDHLLEGLLAVSLELGQLLRQARDQG